MLKMTVVLAGAVALAGCNNMGGGEAASAGSTAMEAPTAPGGAEAILRTADGTTVGRVMARESGGAIRVMVEGSGMPPGTHGAHVHAVGRCDPPSFESAGPHWNPTTKQHGMMNPMGPHAGDAPNLTVGTDGRGTLDTTLPAGTLAGLLDADGSAFVIHAGPDDMHTDPSGNSGGRIACGVFVRS